MKRILFFLLPFAKGYKKFSNSGQQSSYWGYLKFKFGISKRYWPAHRNCVLANPHRIYVGINSLVGRPGNYLQGAGGLYIGDYVQLAPNVGVLTSNHDIYDQRLSVKKEVRIGNYCWVGMNSTILPGVQLGTRTIVAAGSVVTKSFQDGFCVIGGVPATIIKYLDKEKFIPWKDADEFYGFVSKNEFENNQSRYFQNNNSYKF